MKEATQYRVACAFHAGLCLLVVCLLLGPYLYDVSFELMSTAVRLWCVGLSLLGLWFIAVALLADDKDVESVAQLPLAQEGMFLVLPYFLFVVTRSIYRRFRVNTREI